MRIAVCAAPTPTTTWRQFCRETFLVGQREERREGSVVTEEELRRLLLDRQVACEPAPPVTEHPGEWALLGAVSITRRRGTADGPARRRRSISSTTNLRGAVSG